MALEATTGITHKDTRFNPKAIRAPEMYGEIDPLSGEWTTGVFAAMWSKYNNRQANVNTIYLYTILHTQESAVLFFWVHRCCYKHTLLVLANRQNASSFRSSFFVVLT
jgi:hypothetical protein